MGTNDEERNQIREWVQTYRTWNEHKIARRRAAAGHLPLEEKLSAFLDLCAAIQQLSDPKSSGLYQAQLRTHIVVQDRIQRVERQRSHGKSST